MPWPAAATTGSGPPRLVSFADSRQAAARTALDVENLHHRDLLREVLMVTLMDVDARRQQAAEVRRGNHPQAVKLARCRAGPQRPAPERPG